MCKVHLVKDHVVYMYQIDTLYVQNNLPTELKGTATLMVTMFCMKDLNKP